ncbi:hypothetical protein LLG95_01825 [bacterium]|nr:hypothetical protein [bacterium]
MNALGHQGRLWRRGLVIIISLMLGFGLSGWASGVASSTFRIVLDAVGCGGGSSSSAHYLQMDSAVGQDSPAGLAASASYSDNSGAVQAWPVIRNAVDEWSRY